MADTADEAATLSYLLQCIRALRFVSHVVNHVQGLQGDELGVQVPCDTLKSWSVQFDELACSFETVTDRNLHSQSTLGSVVSLTEQCKSFVSHVKTRVSRTRAAAAGNMGSWPQEDLRALAIKVRDLSAELQTTVASSVRQHVSLERFLALTHSDPNGKDEAKCAGKILHRQPLLDMKMTASHNNDDSNEMHGDPGDADHTIEEDQVLREQAVSDKGEILQEFILENLQFGSMNDRADEIAIAYQNTFEWAFTRQSSSTDGLNLLEWLRDPKSTLYWITGKPGSGKSTLMRYLSSHSATYEALKQWAGQKDVTFASFYFWISGSLVQRSQTGLLRHILHQLLMQHPRLVPLVFPALWRRCWTSNTRERLQMIFSWEANDLVDGLKRFLRSLPAPNKTAIFIDGLDEFDGSHEHIIGLLRELLALAKGRLKLLVSSREWDVFEHAFANVAKLRVQDLTASDITRYIDDRLFKKGHIIEVSRMTGDERDRMRLHLVEKAGGVFLWITLAVAYLLDKSAGMQNKISTIRERMEELPNDLDTLFDFLLFETRNLKQVNQAFRIFEILKAREEVCLTTGDESAQSPLLWELASAQTATGETVLQTKIAKLPDDKIMTACEQTRRVLQISCAGLIEAHMKRRSRNSRTPLMAGEDPFDVLHRLAEGKVTYLHRTVKDHISSKAFQAMIRTRVDTNVFDPHLANLIACIMWLKMPPEKPEKHRRLDERWTLIVLAMTHARLSHPQSSEMIILLVDDLNETMSKLWETRRDDESDTWAWSCFSSFEQRAKMLFDDPWLSLAARFGLRRYVEAKLRDTGSVPYKGGWPILHYANEYLIDRQQSVFPLSNPELVRLLMTHEADANRSYGKSRTTWKSVLESLRQAHRRQWIQHYDTATDGVARWFEILQTLLEHGADANAFLPSTHKDPAVTALELCDMILQRYGLAQMESFRHLLLEKGADAGRKGADLDAVEKAAAAKAAKEARAAQAAQEAEEKLQTHHDTTFAGPRIGRRPGRASKVKQHFLMSRGGDEDEELG